MHPGGAVHHKVVVALRLGGTGCNERLNRVQEETRKGKALFRVKWFKLACYVIQRGNTNEAHNIKNRNTKTTVACCELEEKYRCALNVHPMPKTI